jgi:signal peptidase I
MSSAAPTAPVATRAPLLRRLVYLLTAATVAILLAPVFTAFGLDAPVAYVLVSGTSMEPTLSGGDLVVVVRRADYTPGDVVVYRVPEGEVGAGSLVIHRVVGGSADRGYVLRGDNRDHRDVWRPTQRHVVGKVTATLPRVGRVLARLRSSFGLASIAAVLAFALVLPPRRG